MNSSHTLHQPDGTAIACHKTPGQGPGVVFLGGFLSDMTGEKAVAVTAMAAECGLAALRFDYRGHGQSGGVFEACTISDWLADVLLVLDQATDGPQILVGSSMGGWLAILAALARPGKICGIVTIAAAIDMTQEMIEDKLTDQHRALLDKQGYLPHRSSITGRDYKITRALIDDGRRHRIAGRPIAYDGPVRLLHGLNDNDIPPAASERLLRDLTSQDVQLTFVKDGDHRLTRPNDIALIKSTLAGLLLPFAEAQGV